MVQSHSNRDLLVALAGLDKMAVQSAINTLPSESIDRAQLVETIFYVLDYFLRQGDTKLVPIEGSCRSETCLKGCHGYSFMGDKSKHHLDIVFEVRDHELVNILDCVEFSTYEDVEQLRLITFDLKEIETNPGYTPF